MVSALFTRFEISGNLSQDVKALSDMELSRVLLSNSASSLKTLGVPLIHYCFTKLKLYGAERVILNVSNDMAALYAGMKLNYDLEHSFSSETVISIINAYKKAREQGY